MFEHNMPGSNLTVMVEIYTVSGKLIKTIRTNILNNSTVTSDKICGDENSSSNSYRVDGIMWDGTDDYGDLIGKGVYVYRISVLSDNGMKANKLEKLVVLK
jgi:flagellar hook assembly protein FlgD